MKHIACVLLSGAAGGRADAAAAAPKATGSCVRGEDDVRYAGGGLADSAAPARPEGPYDSQAQAKCGKPRE